MTQDEAFVAIKRAERIYVHVQTSGGSSHTSNYTAHFRVSKEDAVDAMREILGSDHEANVGVAEDGSVVVMGSKQPPSS